jgi:glycosyltransferase involved in cell wall biosynthesis
MASDVTAIMTAMTDAERPWVVEALRSILDQTVPPERTVVLVQETNTWIDEELAAAGLAGLVPEKVLVHRMPLARLGAVRNTGVQLAATRWVAFLDGDDFWLPHRLEVQLAAARAHPEVEFISGDLVFVNLHGERFAYTNGSNPSPVAWLVTRRLMLEYPFDGEAKLGEDYLWLKSTHGKHPRLRVPEVVMCYRIRGMSMSSTHFGYSAQRRRRELMSRLSRFPFVRYPILAATFVRYWTRRGTTYDV